MGVGGVDVLHEYVLFYAPFAEGDDDADDLLQVVILCAVFPQAVDYLLVLLGIGKL